MFGIVGYTGFVVSAILLNITPGADTIYILSRSAVGGFKQGAVSALGISTGILIHTVLAALGLSIILAKSAVLFNIMKIIGCAYLVIMGIKTIVSKQNIMDFSAKSESENLLKTYRQGVLTNALNPKVALFFLSLLPQFVAPDNQYGPLPFLILGLTFFTTSTIWSLFVAYISSFISRLLASSKKASMIASKMSGVIYILLGLNILRTGINL